MLRDIYSAYGFRETCFRDFNVAVADPSGSIGEAHDPDAHLTPHVLKSTSSGRCVLKVFGDNYKNHGGTWVLGYVHVTDLIRLIYGP
ncbi:MAG: UDP-glucose 4-epimerase [Chitinophagales bacterium]|jgi:UDP-glucose 4-epimerase